MLGDRCFFPAAPTPSTATGPCSRARRARLLRIVGQCGPSNIPAHAVAASPCEDEHEHRPACDESEEPCHNCLLSCRFPCREKSCSCCVEPWLCRQVCSAVRSGSPEAPRPPGGTAPLRGGRRPGARRGRPARPMPRLGGSRTKAGRSASSASASAVSASSRRSCSSSARPEDEPRVADLVDAVLAPVEPAQRVARVLLGRDRIAGPQVHLRERRHDRRHVVVVAVLERDGERLLEALDRPVGLAEQELEPAEVVEQPADVRCGRSAPRTPTSPAPRTCARAPSARRARRSARPGSTPRRARARPSSPPRARATRSTSSRAAS